MAVRSVLDVLATEGAITLTQAAEIRREARKNGVSIEDELFSRGLAEADILKARGEALGLPIIDLSGKKVEFNLLKAVPEESARRYKFVPLGIEEGVLHVGMLQPDSMEAMEALKFIAGRLGKPFKIFLISKHDFNNILNEYRGITGEVSKVLGELETAIAAIDKYCCAGGIRGGRSDNKNGGGYIAPRDGRARFRHSYRARQGKTAGKVQG